MFKELVSLVAFASLVLTALAPHPTGRRAVRSEASPVADSALDAPDYGKLPLVFEKNQGQTDSRVQFLGRANGYTLFLTEQGATFKLRRSADKTATLNMRAVGANPSPRISGLNELPGKTNYYTGKDPKGWHEGVANYAKVRYENLYDGVDMIYYAIGNELEYDFALAPQSDPSRIKLRFDGAEKIVIGENGDLQIHVDGEIFEQKRPVSYQEINGKKHLVESDFRFMDDQEVGFALGEYDKDQPLTIDPAIRYATYIGGNNGSESATAVAVDPQRQAYLVGHTSSTDFNPNALVRDNAAYVAKLNTIGSQLLFLTILDGEEHDVADDVAIDDFGNAYLTGQTKSEQFPVLFAYQPTAQPCLRINNCTWRDMDAFVVKVNIIGQLVNSTYLGGRDWDSGSGIAVKADGSLAYIAGSTFAANFPNVDEYQGGGAFGNGGDAFLTVMPMNGNPPIYSTQFGGNDLDGAEDVAIDSAGNAYITGNTDSTDMPVKSAYQAFNGGGNDGFVAKFNPNNSGEASLVYATYFGGGGGEYPKGIAVTAQGKAHVTGVTGSFNFPLLNPLDTTNQINEAFVTVFNSNGSLLASTFIGGNGEDLGEAIALDAGENIYLTGSTTSSNFPTVFAFQTARNGARDAFITKLRLGTSTATNAILSSSYMGGSGTDVGGGIAVVGNKDIYVVGRTDSNDFPTSGGAVKQDVLVGNTFNKGFAAHLLDTQRDTVGIYNPNVTEFQLRNSNSPTGSTTIISVDFGNSGHIPITADWDGDGIDTIGVFSNGVWQYRNTNTGFVLPQFVQSFSFGQSGDIPLAGDWNGDGIETPGVFRPSTQGFFLSDSLFNPQTDHFVNFGLNGDRPIVGDWDGDGFDSPGVYRPSDGTFRLTNALTGAPPADDTFQLGIAQDLPIAGDWNADGFEDVALWRPSTFTFSFRINPINGSTLTLPSLIFGSSGNLPLAGEWNGKP